MLLAVALDQPERLLARVAQRVTEGGHAVLPERILARYPRTLAHLTQAVRLADAAILYDSADVTPGTHTAVATCKGPIRELKRLSSENIRRLSMAHVQPDAANQTRQASVAKALSPANRNHRLQLSKVLQ